MTKRKGTLKKNQNQRQQYKKYVSSLSNSPDSTVPSYNPMLIGSDEISADNQDEELHGEETVKKTPLKYRAIDWLKKNVGVAVVTAIIIGVGTALINHGINLSVLSQRVDYLEKRIENINEEYVEKDYLQIQLELLKSEMQNDKNQSLNDINLKIKEIEIRLNALEESDN